MKECLLALGSALMTILSVPVPHSGNLAATHLSYEDTTYTKVITERSGKIVATLGISDSTVYYRVRGLIVDQYRALNAIYTDRDVQLKTLKNQQPAPDKATVDSVKKEAEKTVEAKLDPLHHAYLTRLGKELSPAQVDKVKDGMTYSVLEVTYRAYLEELPSLTDQQKATILADLTEAREHAMDAESSEKKHAWFGKYKGRINNYLSAQGIDMKKAGDEWQKRRKGQ
ncbi:MAG TPA: DUF3826 domain-containing protein [Puia sp.]|jgi:hypothetical protein